MNKLFILSGASCVGKSTLLQRLVMDGHCSLASKYSTRDKRSGLYDDILHTDELENFCDITYKMYNMEYGINSNEIKNKLNENNQGIIVSDIKTIKKLINIFQNNLQIVCIILLNRRIEDFVNTMFVRDNIICKNKIKENIFDSIKKIN